jgi:hypothetical protein
MVLRSYGRGFEPRIGLIFCFAVFCLVVARRSFLEIIIRRSGVLPIQGYEFHRCGMTARRDMGVARGTCFWTRRHIFFTRAGR